MGEGRSVSPVDECGRVSICRHGCVFFGGGGDNQQLSACTVLRSNLEAAVLCLCVCLDSVIIASALGNPRHTLPNCAQRC